MAIGANHINALRSRCEGKEHLCEAFRVIREPVRFRLCTRTSEARSSDAIQRLIICVRRTKIQVAFLPAHRLSLDFPRPGHGGNFTLSGSECSTPQHEERYRPWTWLISPELCIATLLVDRVTSAWPHADTGSSRMRLVAESPSEPIQLSAGLVDSS